MTRSQVVTSLMTRGWRLWPAGADEPLTLKDADTAELPALLRQRKVTWRPPGWRPLEESTST